MNAIRSRPRTAAPPVSGPDPILAVIAEHRAAQEDVWTSCKATDLDIDDDPNKQRAMDRASKAELPLFTTKPTTLAGVVALLDYVGSEAHKTNRERDNQTVLAFAQGWTSKKRSKAAYQFPRHIAAVLRNIIERGQA